MMLYDIEIKRMIPDHRRDPIEGLEYCQGWTDFQGMGIAVVCAYEYERDAYAVFCDDNLSGLKLLIEKQDRVIGFNNHSFDDRLLEAYHISIGAERSADLLRAIVQAKGVPFSPKACKGLKLDALARVNLNGAGKSGNGALAPMLYQRHMTGTLINYCLRDVRLLKGLVDLARARGYLICPNTGERIAIEICP